eukprot:3083102-Rhodomonas_salina.1
MGADRWRLICTPRNQAQETAFSVQIVPGMRFLVFEFAVYDPQMMSSIDTARCCAVCMTLCDVWYSDGGPALCFVRY